jgi:hypothetical protein
MGSRLLKNWLLSPRRERSQAVARLETISTLRAGLQQTLRARLKGCSDVERITARIAVRQVRPRELIALRDTLHKAEQLSLMPDSLPAMTGQPESPGLLQKIFEDLQAPPACAALLVRWFRAMGAELPIYVPDRITEGYGPSARAFDTLKASGADLVITVDCGAAANEAVAHAAAIGLNVVVIDHHMMREHPPVCAAVVNPNRPGCNSGQGNLAAAGVVFVLLAALNREARRRGMFAVVKEPDLRQWLDLAAMGAICDVTGLTGFNRALTSLGLRVMSDWGNPGLRALLAAAGAEPGPAKSNHAGFILGPRINAGGRIGKSDGAVRVMLSRTVQKLQQRLGK